MLPLNDGGRMTTRPCVSTPNNPIAMNKIELQTHGYAAHWDGYDINCMKGYLTRQDNNEWVKGWLKGQGNG